MKKKPRLHDVMNHKQSQASKITSEAAAISEQSGESEAIKASAHSNLFFSLQTMDIKINLEMQINEKEKRLQEGVNHKATKGVFTNICCL